jgi:16S rRNA (adenine(1408)-N(1))-methyltransferase
MEAEAFMLRAGGYETVLVDLGTGDGRFVLDAARRNPRLFAIGVDACRENLAASSRAAGSNCLFIIASASALPAELTGLAGRITVNFPWGSLRDGLLGGDDALLGGLRALARPDARLDVLLNASALAEAGWELVPGGERIRSALAGAGFTPRRPRLLDAAALRAIPTTWAKRLAFSRRPEAVAISAKR